MSMGFSRQEYWRRLPLPSPGALPDSGIEPTSPALHADSLPLSQQRSPYYRWRMGQHGSWEPSGKSQELCFLDRSKERFLGLCLGSRVSGKAVDVGEVYAKKILGTRAGMINSSSGATSSSLRITWRACWNSLLDSKPRDSDSVGSGWVQAWESAFQKVLRQCWCCMLKL